MMSYGVRKDCSFVGYVNNLDPSHYLTILIIFIIP